MVSEDGHDHLITYKVIDAYAEKHFPKEYATLPDPSAVQIDIIPDEELKPNTRTWPCMREPRVKIGHLIEQQDGHSMRAFANNVYASVSEESRESSRRGKIVVFRVWYSTRDKKLSNEGFPEIQWLQPFGDIRAGKRDESTERSHLRTLVIYYLMANAHVDTVQTTMDAFLADFQASCVCVARMRQVRQGPGLEEAPLSSPSLQDYDPTTPKAYRTRKRPREDEGDPRSSTPVEGRHDEFSLPTMATSASRGNADKDIVESPDVDAFLGFAESYKKMKTKNHLLEGKNRKYKAANRKHVAEQGLARTDIAQLEDDLRARDTTIQAQKAHIERLKDCVSQERMLSEIWKEKADQRKERLQAMTKTVKQKKASLMLAIADIVDIADIREEN